MIKVKLSEYSKSESFSVTEEQFDILNQVKFFKLITGSKHGSVRVESSSYVGLFHYDGLSIYIEPKVGDVNFLKMLVLGDDEATEHDTRSLNHHNDPDYTLWDFLALTICDELDNIVKTGLDHKYVEQEGNLHFLRGAIDFQQNLINNLVNQARVYCKFDEFSSNIEQNQAIKWALNILPFCVDKKEIKQKIRYFDTFFSSIELQPEPVRLSPKTVSIKYQKIIRLINLIVDNLASNMGLDGYSGHGYFVDMNKVFEGFVRNQLRHTLKDTDLIVPPKNSVSTNLCKNVRLEPDIVIKQQEIVTHILDCKYKVDWHFNNNDVFQMLAYLEGYNSTTLSYILYPTESEEIMTESISYPRSGVLIKIGIPIPQLLNFDFWKYLKASFIKSKLTA